MKLGDFIKNSFARLINRNGTVFKALLVDNGSGTLEKLLNDAEVCRVRWCDENDFYELTGERFEKCASLFCILKRMYQENDDSFKARIRAVLRRADDDLWGDKWNLIHVIKLYFGADKVWICNSTDDISHNLLKDYDFENHTSEWSLVGGAEYSEKANFSGDFGVFFRSLGTCSQTVYVSPESTYFLHFFLQGTVNVVVQDNSGRYYCTKRGDFGAWQQNKCVTTFACEEWDAKSLFFITDNNVSSITITFEYAEAEAYLDYTRLFLMDGSISFSVVIRSRNESGDETLFLVPGTDDPIKSVGDIAGFYTEGTQDVQETDSSEQSFYDFDSAAIIDEVSPILTSGEDDFIPTPNLDNRTYIGLDTWCMNGEIVTFDYDSAPYYNNTFMQGAAGLFAESAYKELLDILSAGGTTPFLELVTYENKDEEDI